MSGQYCRDMFRTWLNALPVPYYDTINLEQSPTDDIWTTAIFLPFSVETLDYCEGREETGEVQVIWLGKPGIGDAALLAAVELHVIQLMSQEDPTGKLVIAGRTAISEYSGPDAPHYEMAVSILYTLKGV